VRDDVKRTFGAVPDLAKALANSPTALKGFLDLRGAPEAGLSEAVVVEAVANAALDIWTDDVNEAPGAEVDRPPVEPLTA
jgi:hypothetical protein